MGNVWFHVLFLLLVFVGYAAWNRHPMFLFVVDIPKWSRPNTQRTPRHRRKDSIEMDLEMDLEMAFQVTMLPNAEDRLMGS